MDTREQGGPPAWLAICSDLDETPDAATYFEQMRFLNTIQETAVGQGVGLEVGNSMYFDMAPGEFCYWNSTPADRERIRLLIRSGHIDCLHSYGDLACTRGHAERAIEELDSHGCRFSVWVDHAKAPSNFGADIMRGSGDDPSQPVYHADLTIGHGVRHVWRGRVTGVIGQERRWSLSGIGTPRHPVSSGTTFVKEAGKRILGSMGSMKYAMHRDNRLTREIRLRDGQGVVEFMRCNPSWGGVSCHDRGDAIDKVLTSGFLDRLAERGGCCVLYTHLGKIDRNQPGAFFSPAVVAAFRLLALYQHQGRIRVTTTSRLLDHVVSGGAVGPGSPLVFPEIGLGR